MNAVYLIDGKPHRICDCNTMSPACQKGRLRTLQTCGFSQCLIPAPDVILMEGSGTFNAAASETQAPITDNDRRWRFLEHGCQWVSFTPIGGDTRSFDPRILSGYAGHLQDMRATVDRETEKHLAILKEGINAAKR